MSNEIRNKKIINGIIGVILFFVILFGGFWLIDNLFTKELKAQENEINLSSPDLTSKEYLGNGVYRLHEDHGITIDYNIYNGYHIVNGTATVGISLVYINEEQLGIEQGNSYYVKYYLIYGTTNAMNSVSYRTDTTPSVITLSQTNGGTFNVNYEPRLDRGIRVDYKVGDVFDNLTFRVQVEQGTTATPYQTPIGAIQQHEQFIYDDGYDWGFGEGYLDGYWTGFDEGTDDGYDWGFSEGYIDGLDDGLMSVLQVRDYLGYSNLDNIIFLERNQIGPNDRFFGFKIENVDTYIENLTFFSTMLANSDYFAPLNELSSGSKAGITLNYSDNDFIFYSFADMANVNDEYNFHSIEKEKKVEYITVRFLLRENLPGFDFVAFQQSLFQNISLFINDQYFNDLFIKRITDIYYDKGLKDGVSQGLDDGYWEGYDDGLVDNPNNNFGSLITTILLGVGTVLGIELLPNITIGAIIAVPIVFGIIAFVLGKKKE